jgi:hypothetical protein
MLRLIIYLFRPPCKTDARAREDAPLGQAIEKPDVASACRGHVSGLLGLGIVLVPVAMATAEV